MQQHSSSADPLSSSLAIFITGNISKLSSAYCAGFSLPIAAGSLCRYSSAKCPVVSAQDM